MQKKKCFECGCELERDSSGSWSDDSDLVMRGVEFCTDDLEYILSMAYDDQSWDREDEEDLDVDKVSNFIIEYVKSKRKSLGEKIKLGKHIKDIEAELDYMYIREPDEVKYINNLKQELNNLYEKLERVFGVSKD